MGCRAIRGKGWGECTCIANCECINEPSSLGFLLPSALAEALNDPMMYVRTYVCVRHSQD